MIETELPPASMGVLEFKNTLRFYALMDAILSPEWDGRYYSFDSKWAPNEQMGSMRNGQGDDFFAHFMPAGCLLKGFDHESAMSPWSNKDSSIWPGMFSSVPEEFSESLTEPAFDMSNTTFCVWRSEQDTAWWQSNLVLPVGEDPAGMHHLLGDVDFGVGAYCEFAADYYELEIDSALVESIRNGEPLSDSMISSINDEVTLEALASDLDVIDWSSYLPPRVRIH